MNPVPNPKTGNLPLDLIGIAEATDKSSLAGDYLRHYETLFAALRHEKFNLIEIGVLKGGSVRTWSKFFSNAQIVGIDTNRACLPYERERVKIEIGSQADPEFLHRVASLYPPTIIIDDGSHRSDHNIFTFERLFPALLPGGYYVVEDLHFSLDETDAERLRGDSPVLACDYFAALAKDRMGSDRHARRLSGLRQYLIGAIESILVIPQAMIIAKRGAPQLSVELLTAMRPHVEASRDWLNWLRYSQHLLALGQPLAEVADALRKSIKLDDTAVVAYERLSEILERMEDFDGAADTLRRAAAHAGANAELAGSLASRIARMEKAKSARAASPRGT